jgi:hypothetical protein
MERKNFSREEHIIIEENWQDCAPSSLLEGYFLRSGLIKRRIQELGNILEHNVLKEN